MVTPQPLVHARELLLHLLELAVQLLLDPGDLRLDLRLHLGGVAGLVGIIIVIVVAADGDLVVIVIVVVDLTVVIIVITGDSAGRVTGEQVGTDEGRREQRERTHGSSFCRESREARRRWTGYSRNCMKRRWSVLFWSALASLIGLSWFASSFGVGITALISASLVGMVAATVIAFYAMVREIRAKWPAAVVLACAGPMAINVLQSLPDLAMLIKIIGMSFALIAFGTIATVAASVRILTRPLPQPPPPPPVAPARVVE